MVIARRVSLPLAEPARSAPTVDAVRARLGGRARDDERDPAVGTLVRYPVEGDPAGLLGSLAPVGVVLFAREGSLDVWAGGGRVRKVPRERATTEAPEANPSEETLEMHAVAADALAFHSLREGARVRFTTGGTMGEGTLVERCRFGALVLRDDGSVAGVGFRALWALEGERT